MDEFEDNLRLGLKNLANVIVPKAPWTAQATYSKLELLPKKKKRRFSKPLVIGVPVAIVLLGAIGVLAADSQSANPSQWIQFVSDASKECNLNASVCLTGLEPWSSSTRANWSNLQPLASPSPSILPTPISTPSQASPSSSPIVSPSPSSSPSPTVTPSANPSPSKLFTDTFIQPDVAGSPPNGWSSSSGFTVQSDGVSVLASTSINPDLISVSSGSNWSHYSVRVDVKPGATGVRLLYHLQDSSNYYFCGLENQNLDVGVVSNGVTTILTTRAYATVNSTWYTLIASDQGGQGLSCVANQVSVSTSSLTFPSGTIGVWTKNAGPEFANFAVSPD